LSFDEIAPRNFSFNSPYGACEQCTGLGFHTVIDPKLVIPDMDLSLDEGALAPFANTSSAYFPAIYRGLEKKFKIGTSTPIRKLTKQQIDILLNGTNERIPISFTDRRGYRRSYNAMWNGAIGILDRRSKETTSQYIRDEVARYQSAQPCAACGGMRLKPESLAVTLDVANDEGVIAPMHISAMAGLSVARFEGILDRIILTEREGMIARQILKELRSRSGFLNAVGLTYLTLDRAAGTLAGGEAQRIRLATQIGSGLMGVVYILDEPSIGLHQRDNRRLIDTLTELRDLGNTILIVEHDEETMRAADHIIDIGPGAASTVARSWLRVRSRTLSHQRSPQPALTFPGGARSRFLSAAASRKPDRSR